MQPYVALGKALQAQGHDVLLAAPDNFAAWVESHGLRFHGLGMDMEVFLQSPEVRRVLSGNWFALTKLWRRTIMPLVRNVLDATWDAGRDADVLVYHPKVAGAADVAEVTGARLVCASPVPLFPTGAFPLVISKWNFGPWLNRLTYRAYYMSRPRICESSTAGAPSRWGSARARYSRRLGVTRAAWQRGSTPSHRPSFLGRTTGTTTPT